MHGTGGAVRERSDSWAEAYDQITKLLSSMADASSVAGYKKSVLGIYQAQYRTLNHALLA